MLDGEADASPLLHFGRQLLHGFRRNGETLASCQGCLGSINCRQNLGAATLARFPERQGLLHRIFCATQAPRLDGVADERFLVWGEVNIHAPRVEADENRCQGFRRRVRSGRGGRR